MAIATETDSQTRDPFASVRKLEPGLRTDLKITRTLTQGVPVYVVFDPVKFQSHRLSLLDYRVAGSLQDGRTLQESFEACVHNGVLEKDDETIFFEFVSQLQTLGLLTTSKQDAETLYRQFQNRENAKQKNLLFSLVFATIPLSKPDRFLENTLPMVSWLFTKTALVFWSILGIGAAALVFNRLHAFVSPLNGELAAENLAFLTLSFVALKIVHELGHGYACRKYGGAVPEMGCKLIALMPLAYVDTSSAWSFPRQTHRLIVMLAGMYVEAIIAIVGVFIWVATPHSFLGSCAYQLIFMAGLATVLFNANPLMKYDGYFVLSDLLGIPNLRARSTEYLHSVLKRIFLGIDSDQKALSARDRTIYLSYGFCASIYSTLLTVSIAFMIATMFGALGVIIAFLQIIGMARKSIVGFFGYLWNSDETATVRGRSRSMAVFVGTVVPLLIGFFPIPGRIVVPGVASGSNLISVRTPTEGFIAEVAAVSTERILPGEHLVTLENLGIENSHAVQSINAAIARQKATVASRNDPAEGKKLEVMANESHARQRMFEKEFEDLNIKSPQGGRLAFLIDRDRIGSFVQAGEIIAKVAAGDCIVRAWISEDKLSKSIIELDESIELRFADRPMETHSGSIVTLAPAKKSQFEDLALTTMGNGGIKIDPKTGQTEENLYMLEVKVRNLSAENIRLDSRVNIVLRKRNQTLLDWSVRSLRKFAGQLTL